jgi:hypothetical protein
VKNTEKKSLSIIACKEVYHSVSVSKQVAWKKCIAIYISYLSICRTVVGKKIVLYRILRFICEIENQEKETPLTEEANHISNTFHLVQSVPQTSCYF